MNLTRIVMEPSTGNIYLVPLLREQECLDNGFVYLKFGEDIYGDSGNISIEISDIIVHTNLKKTTKVEF